MVALTVEREGSGVLVESGDGGGGGQSPMLGSGEMASRERGDFSEVLASRKMIVGEKNGKKGAPTAFKEVGRRAVLHSCRLVCAKREGFSWDAARCLANAVEGEEAGLTGGPR
jgi:hypothetical protein